MKMQKVGVLMGGLSSERAISLQTGDAITTALFELGYDTEAIFVDRDIDLVLRSVQPDVAFVALHGRYGEDGCIQGLLETLGIPYTGSGVLASALAMDKQMAKQLFRLHNLPTPPSYVLHRNQFDHTNPSSFGFPVVVKPRSEGSSVGVQLAENADEFRAACEDGFRFDEELLIERFIAGQEISVAVLEDRAIGAVEITTDSVLYDYKAKYSDPNTAYYIPPRISPERYRGIITQAEKAHRALGCSGATRVDMIVAASGNEYILEVNTQPGLTPTSLLPKIADSVGLSFQDLVEGMLLGARLGNRSTEHGDRRVSQRFFRGDDRREPLAGQH